MPLPLNTEYVPCSGVPGGVGAGAVVVAAVVVVVGGAVVVARSAVQTLSAITRVWNCINGSYGKSQRSAQPGRPGRYLLDSGRSPACTPPVSCRGR